MYHASYIYMYIYTYNTITHVLTRENSKMVVYSTSRRKAKFKVLRVHYCFVWIYDQLMKYQMWYTSLCPAVRRYNTYIRTHFQLDSRSIYIEFDGEHLLIIWKNSCLGGVWHGLCNRSKRICIIFHLVKNKNKKTCKIINCGKKKSNKK